MATIAYGSITILDLIDTATYIYYSSNENGEGATIAPSTDSQYIGIYSGPPVGDKQPDSPPDGTVWTKYVGKNSEVVGTTYRYLISDSDIQPLPTDTRWETQIPSAQQGKYLWIETTTTYNFGEPSVSYSYSYMGVDGEDGDSYLIETNQEEILKFKNDEKVELSPETLEIEIKKVKDNTYFQMEDVTIELKFSDFSFINSDVDDGGTGLKQDTFGDITSTLEEYISKEAKSSKCIISFTEFLNAESKSDEQIKLQELILSRDNILKIIVKEKNSDQIIAIKVLSFRYGLTSDLLDFSINAKNINASIQSTKLTFDEYGLTIGNGGFRINGTTEEDSSTRTLFEITENGELKIVGSGTFEGEIIANEGSFSGTITAKQGELQNLNISGVLTVQKHIEDPENPDSTLVLSDENIQISGQDGTISSSNYSEADKTGFSINSNGTIYANELKLGSNAEITDYLKLGNYTYLYNAIPNDGVVLYSTSPESNTSLTLKDNGTIEAGGIVIDGPNSTIRGLPINSDDGNLDYYWSLTPSAAQFKNVVVTGSIKASVLEYGETQAVGGILLVRPSSIIKSVFTEIDQDTQKTKYLITLEDKENSGFFSGDLCKIGEDFYCTITIDSQERINLNIDEYLNFESLIGEVCVSFGKDRTIDAENKIVNGDVGISINSSKNAANGFPDQAITVFENIGLEQGVLSTNNHVIIGKIPDNKDFYGTLAGSWGLYADNVLVRGSMIAEQKAIKDEEDEEKIIKPGYVSGISTKSGVIMPDSNDSGELYFPDFSQSTIKSKDVGEILLWAGALDSSSDSIRSANFRVDVYGNLYAGSGYFNGTIISNATIQAAKIQTAIIEGVGDTKIGGTTENPKTAALVIQNADEGISFWNGDDKNPQEWFRTDADATWILNQAEFGEVVRFSKNISVYPSVKDEEVALRSVKLSVGEFNSNEVGDTIFSSKIDLLNDGYLKFYEGSFSLNGEKDNNIDYFNIKQEIKNDSSNEIENKTIASLNKDNAKFSGSLVTKKELHLTNNSDQDKMIIQVVSNEEYIVGYDIYIMADEIPEIPEIKE